MNRDRTVRGKVINPEWSADRPAVVVSLRESSVVALFNRGLLNADQVAAAWRFRRSWEIMAGISSGGPDPERVRTGRHPADPGERKMLAAFEQRLSRRRLGEHGYALVSKVCGEGFHIRDLYPSRRERDTATDILRIQLSELATMWG